MLSLFPACCVISLSLATASNNRHSSTSRSQVLSCNRRPFRTLVNCQLVYSAMSSQPPLQSSTELVSPVIFIITPRRGPHRKRPVSNCKSIIACIFVSAGTCLPSPCSETAVCLCAYCIATAVPVFVSRTLPSKRSIRHNIMSHLNPVHKISF
jgi:hypothetical protein